MANTSISNLAAGAAVAATDVMPNVQTAGVGPVKTTAAQLKTFMSASPTFVTPALGTPTSGDFSTGTFTWPTFNQNTTGTAAGLSATLVVGSGGTGTSTAFTSGSIVFAGASGVYSQNNSALFWNNTLTRLGIGTAAPSEIVEGSVNSASFVVFKATNTAGYAKFGARDSGEAYFEADSTKAISFWNTTRKMTIDTSGNLLLGTDTSPTTGTRSFTIANGTAPTASPADTITIYSTDLTAGNTMLSLYTEGTPVNANATATATHRIAIRVNGTVYYLLANTSA